MTSFLRCVRYLPVVLVLVSWGQTAFADELTARALLKKMVSALQNQSFQGNFTYEQDGKLHSIQMAHAVIDGVKYEKVYFLNGKKRELVRSGRVEGCETVGEFLFKGGSIKLPGGAVTDLLKHYSTRVVGKDRIADRYAWVIDIQPRDDHRYGYVLSVDEQTGLPLKAVVKVPGQKILERFSFVNIDVPASLKKNDFMVDASATNQQECLAQNLPVRAQSPLQPGWLPQGFVLSGYQKTASGAHVQTYTDGLSFFSIVVESQQSMVAAPEGSQLTQAEAHRGATVVLMTSIPRENYAINLSVVGEIPVKVARKVTLSMR